MERAEPGHDRAGVVADDAAMVGLPVGVAGIALTGESRAGQIPPGARPVELRTARAALTVRLEAAVRVRTSTARRPERQPGSGA